MITFVGEDNRWFQLLIAVLIIFGIRVGACLQGLSDRAADSGLLPQSHPA